MMGNSFSLVIQLKYIVFATTSDSIHSDERYKFETSQRSCFDVHFTSNIDVHLRSSWKLTSVDIPESYLVPIASSSATTQNGFFAAPFDYPIFAVCKKTCYETATLTYEARSYSIVGVSLTLFFFNTVRNEYTQRFNSRTS